MSALNLEVFRNLDNLPSPPFQLLKVLDQLDQTTFRDFNVCRMIQNDPSMACRILQLANSRIYGYPSKILSLNQAAGLLGPSPIKNIILTTPMLERMGIEAATEAKLDCIRPWQHMSVTAMIAGCLGKRVPQMEPDICYTAGLIHDIGKIALLVHHPSLLVKAIQGTQEKDISLSEAEQEILGCSHAKITAEMTVAWGFPDFLTSALGDLPDLRFSGSKQEARFAGTIFLADYLANDWAFDDGMEQNAGPLPKEIFDRLGITSGDLESWRPELKEAALYAAED